MEPRSPRSTAGARSRIRQLEQRLARLESELKRARGQGSRASGATRLRLKGLEKVAKAQIARAQVTLRTSMRRLSRNLEGSRKTVESQVRLLTRGLKAGIRAGSAAYRRPRG